MASGMEILAGAFAVLVLVKVVMNFVDQKGSVKKATKILENEKLAIGLYVVLALLTGSIVISALGIVAAFAAVTFGASLVGLSIIMYPKEVLKMIKTMMKDKKRIAFPLIVWAVLAVWTLFALYVQYIGI